MQNDKGLLSRYAKGERDFSGENFNWLCLSGNPRQKIDLSNTNFSNTNFENATLRYCILNNVNFTGSNFTKARIFSEINNSDFSQANLSNTRIAGQINNTKFISANFTNAEVNVYALNKSVGNLDFSQANCQNTQLSGYLVKANFQNANLTTTKFKRPNLEESDFSFQDLSRKNFANLILKKANFSNCNLIEVNFEGANLELANFSNANLKKANFSNMNLEGVNFNNANVLDTIFNNANLKNINFDGATHLNSKIYLAWKIINHGTDSENLQNADLSEVDLSSVNFGGINLTRVNFTKTNLKGANFSNSNLTQAILKHTNLTNSNLTNTNLSQAQLNGANLYWANLNLTNLTNSNLQTANLTRAKLEGADLTDANLTDANLDSTNLSNANLTNTNLTRTKLFKVNLTDAINPPSVISIFENSPDNPNLELLQQLRENSQNLSYPSEADEPYEIYLWETAKMGNFSLAGLLQAFGHLSIVDSDLFINGNVEKLRLLHTNNNYYHKSNQAQDVITVFRNIITGINTYTNNLQILRLETTAIQSLGQDFYLLLANTSSGDWLGISTKVSSYLQQEHYSSSIFRFKDLAISNPENKELIVTLENTITDIKISAIELETLTWEIAETKEAVIHNLLDSMLIVTTDEVDGVFSSYYDEELEEDLDEEAREEIAKHDCANNLITSHLNNLRLYRLSAGEIDMFFAGETNNKDWIIVKTKAVET